MGLLDMFREAVEGDPDPSMAPAQSGIAAGEMKVLNGDAKEHEMSKAAAHVARFQRALQPYYDDKSLQTTNKAKFDELTKWHNYYKALVDVQALKPGEA